MSESPGGLDLILITTDQQRWDAAGIYGNDVIRTPHMDRLGREGVMFVFERAWGSVTPALAGATDKPACQSHPMLDPSKQV